MTSTSIPRKLETDGCPPDMAKDPSDPTKCIPKGEAQEKLNKLIEEDNAGDTAPKGTPVGEAPNSTANPADTHQCEDGFTWDASANDGLGGCVANGPAAGDGSGGQNPTTPGTESNILSFGQFTQYMNKYDEYQKKWQSEFANFMKESTDKLTQKLSEVNTKGGSLILRKEHASFGLAKKEGVQKSSTVNDESYKAVYEKTVTEPADYFYKAAKEKTTISNHQWDVNIGAYLESLTQKWTEWGSHVGARSREEMMSATQEAITISGGDMPQVFAKKIYVIPGGRMRVPIRQFLDVQIIEDADRYNWYKINSFDLDDTTSEGTAPSAESQTVTKVTATPTLKRGLQVVNFSDIENAPFDLIEAFNRAAALGSISEEAKEVLDTTYDAITPTNWVNANTGAAITDDDVASMTMKQEGVYAALDLIERQGGDTSPGNCVLFAHPKAVRELILDTAADFFTGQQPLAHRALGVLENRLGIDIVPTNKVAAQDNTTNDTYRNVLIIKGSIGLAVAADLQLEALRRPDLSAVHVAARHRIKAAVIDETMTCRISSAQ